MIKNILKEVLRVLVGLPILLVFLGTCGLAVAGVRQLASKYDTQWFVIALLFITLIFMVGMVIAMARDIGKLIIK